MSLGTTFSVHKDGRITFTKDMVREMGFKEGDSIKFGWEDSSNPPALSFRKVGKESGRLKCLLNGIDNNEGSAVAYAWFVWEKGHKGDTIIKWIN